MTEKTHEYGAIAPQKYGYNGAPPSTADHFDYLKKAVELMLELPYMGRPREVSVTRDTEELRVSLTRHVGTVPVLRKCVLRG